MLKIVNLIPFGKENAITRTALCNITGLVDREVRRKIAEERRDHVILSVDGGKGYFRPTAEERKDVEIWLKRETARAKSTFGGMKAARAMVKGGNAYETE